MVIPILHHIPSAVRTANGVATAIPVGSYERGVLYVRATSVSGTLRVHWESAPGSHLATAGPFVRVQSLPTFTNATGLRVAAVNVLGAWGRAAFTLGGTAQSTVELWFVGSQP